MLNGVTNDKIALTWTYVWKKMGAHTCTHNSSGQPRSKSFRHMIHSTSNTGGQTEVAEKM